MIINGKSVKGIYIYNPTAEYEKGDFVVDGDCIFICTANSPTDTSKYTVKGQKPIENGKFNSENYKAYPGDLITSADEYYSIIKNNVDGGVVDKYVSSYALCEILKRTYFGINENGVITNHILYSPENNSVDLSVGSKSTTEYLDDTTSILTKILLEPELNNGIVQVSRNLPELKDLFVEQMESDQEIESEYYSNKKVGTKVVLLRQYTYVENEEKYRVQELIDPRTGESFFRYLRSKSLSDNSWAIENELKNYELTGGYISAWVSNFGGTTETQNSSSRRIVNRLNSVIEAYRSRLDDYRHKLTQLDESFRFKEVSGDSVSLSEVPGGSLVTVTCSYKTGDNSNIRLSYSITIPIITSENAVYYLGKYKDQEAYLYQYIGSIGGSQSNIFKMISIPTNSASNIQNSRIDSIYYRRKFNSEEDTII